MPTAKMLILLLSERIPATKHFWVTGKSQITRCKIILVSARRGISDCLGGEQLNYDFRDSE